MHKFPLIYTIIYISLCCGIGRLEASAEPAPKVMLGKEIRIQRKREVKSNKSTVRAKR